METKPEEASRFLTSVFGHYTEGVIEIRSIHKKRGIRRDWIPLPYGLSPRSCKHYGKMVSGYALQGFDVYVSVLPRTGTDNSGRSGVCSIGAVWVDMDHKVQGADVSLLEHTDVIVATGNGYHGYKLLERPKLIKSEKERALYESKVYAFSESILPGLDNVSNLDRILRIPGTLNWKSEDPKPVKLIRATAPPLLSFRSAGGWKPEIDIPGLDDIHILALEGRLGTLSPPLRLPSGRDVYDLDNAVSSCYDYIQLYRHNPIRYDYLLQIARQDMPLIMDYLVGGNDVR